LKKPVALASAIASLAALSLAVSLASPAVAATTEIRPGTLDRGANGTVPHVDGRALVVGDQRYTFPGRELQYLGRSGDDYVLGVWKQGSPRSQKVVRLTPADERTAVLRRVPVSELSLSQDGEQLVRPRFLFRKKQTRVLVWSSHDGSEVASRTFRGYLSVLDADEGRMVLSGSMPDRTFWWNDQSGATERISDRYGYAADIRADRLAVLTGDPYQGGCSVLSTLAHPRAALWRSCDQAVTGFSPSGNRVTTVYLQSDGLGPGTIEVHRSGGKLLERYTTYYFGEVYWESGDTLLMLAHGRTRSAWVRCTGSDCERAGRLRDTDL
jgi:hypothetical protein